MGLLLAALLDDALPPGGHVQDGQLVRPDGRRGPGAQSLRHQGAEGGGRLHHAHRRLGQHQRAMRKSCFCYM